MNCISLRNTICWAQHPAHCRCTQVKTRSSEWTITQQDRHPYQKGNLEADTHRKLPCEEKRQGGISISQVIPKMANKLPEIRRETYHRHPHSLHKESTQPTPWSQTSSFKNWDKFLFEPPSLWNHSSSPGQLIQPCSFRSGAQQLAFSYTRDDLSNSWRQLTCPILKSLPSRVMDCALTSVWPPPCCNLLRFSACVHKSVQAFWMLAFSQLLVIGPSYGLNSASLRKHNKLNPTPSTGP